MILHLCENLWEVIFHDEMMISDEIFHEYIMCVTWNILKFH